MPFTQELTFTLNKLTPLFEAAKSLMLTRKVQANTTVYKGQPLGQTTTGVNEVQTLTITGTPTGGTFRLSFKGIKTAPIAHNANAAAVQSALEALISVGTGNVSCGGGALPGTPVTITFQGALAAGPQPVVVFETADNLLTGGMSPTGSVAVTTKGIAAGALRTWDGTLVAAPPAPTVSAQAGGSVFGDGTNAEPMLVQLTYYNETGETTPGPGAQVVITNTNRTVRVAQISSVGSAVQGARVYFNGVRVAEIAASGGNIPQTDISTIAGSGTPPDVNRCFTARDGSHVLRGFALADFTTDAEGLVTYGQVSTGMEQGQSLAEAPYFAEGYFRMGDLYGINVNNGPQLANFGRFVAGAWNDSEGIYRLGLL